MDQKSVLVIGGGAAGRQIAYDLRDRAKVLLVDPKTYWEVPMAAPRLVVEPDALEARMRYDSFLGAATHVRGKVVALTDNSARVALEEGTETTLKFDYAVIASGSIHVDPVMKARAKTEIERSAELVAMQKKLKAAKSVVIAGAGPVGVETAAEIRETFPHVKVTIVDGAKKLLDKAPSKFAGWAARALREKSVEVILNEFVTAPALGEQPNDRKVRTSGGRTIEADVVIWAAGVKPVTDFVAASWPSAVQSNGQLRVDKFLRLEGHANLFVAGDVTNLPEGRLAIIAGLHAKSVVANLGLLLAAANPAAVSLKPYKPSPPGHGMGKMMIVTLGRRDGLSSLPFGQLRFSFIARQIKARDMLVGMSRKSVGLPGGKPEAKEAPTRLASRFDEAR